MPLNSRKLLSLILSLLLLEVWPIMVQLVPLHSFAYRTLLYQLEGCLYQTNSSRCILLNEKTNEQIIDYKFIHFYYEHYSNKFGIRIASLRISTYVTMMFTRRGLHYYQELFYSKYKSFRIFIQNFVDQFTSPQLQYHIGCSGWSYSAWQGTILSSQRR